MHGIEYHLLDAEDKKLYEECKSYEKRIEIVRKPKYSCGYGDLKGLCPIYLWASQNEGLINDAKLLIEKCKEVGADLEYVLDPYHLHAGPLVDTMGIPESRDAVIIIIEWMKKQLNKVCFQSRFSL